MYHSRSRDARASVAWRQRRRASVSASAPRVSASALGTALASRRSGARVATFALASTCLTLLATQLWPATALAQCASGGGVTTCTNDVSGGAAGIGGDTTINVNNLSKDITPVAGKAGIAITSQGKNDEDPGGNANNVTVTSNTDPFQIKTSGAQGIIAQSIGGFGEDGTFPFDHPGDGGHGGTVTINHQGKIVTDGSAGITAISAGGRGGDGAFAQNGARGGSGSTITVTASGTINTTGNNAAGIAVLSAGGNGGSGGDSFGFNAGDGERGGSGGHVIVTTSSTIATTGDSSAGILARSVGGGGGVGGTGVSFPNEVNGGGAGLGGKVEVHSTSASITTLGNTSAGIFAQSVGGFAGSGGTANFLFVGFGGNSDSGGNAGEVDVTTKAGLISTKGSNSSAIFAQSIGGGGGSGGIGGGLIGFGGPASAGGSGNRVFVENFATLEVKGNQSSGIYAQSVGGGGGSGGPAGGLVAVGGSGDKGGVGGPVEVHNFANIDTYGTGTAGPGSIGSLAVGIFAQSIGGGGGNGGVSGGLVSIGGSGSGGGDAGAVFVENKGAITGHCSIDCSGTNAIFAQSVGGGGGNGGGSGGLAALGGTGGDGGNAGTVTVRNTGNLTGVGANSAALFAQSVGGGGGTGGFAVGAGVFASFALGGDGGAGGNAGNVCVNADDTCTNAVVPGTAATIKTNGDRSSGIFAQSVGGGGGNAGFALAASVGLYANVSLAIGGAGGSGGQGGAVVLGSKGTIETAGQSSHGIFAQSVGGGGGTGGFAISAGASTGGNLSMAFAGAGGDGSDGGEVKVNSETAITTHGPQSSGIYAASVGGGGGNGGFAVAAGGGTYGAASLAFGGTGGNGGDASNVTVTSKGSITTHGSQSYGIFAESVGGGGGNGGFAVAGALTFNQAGGSISVALGGDGGMGGKAGDNTKVTSQGDITTTGNASIGIFAQSVGGGGGNGGFSGAISLANGAAFSASIGGKGGDGNAAGKVEVTSTGNITTGAGDATEENKTPANSIGILAQSIGGGGGNGGFSISVAATMQSNAIGQAEGGTAGKGGIGNDVTVTSNGTISTQGALAHGILAQSVGGGGGNGGFAIGGALSYNGAADMSAIGGRGSEGNTAGAVTVNTNATSIDGFTVRTNGDGAIGILAQSIGGGGGNGGFAISGAISAGDKATNNTIGGNGGTGADAGIVKVTNVGKISTTGANATAILAQSIGGGGGNGGFTISVAATVADDAKGAAQGVGGQGGVGGEGKAVTVDHTGAITTVKDLSYGILAQSVGGGGGNGGFAISGALSTDGEAASNSVGGSAGAGSKGGDVTVTVQAGSSIETQGAGSGAILAQSVGGGGGTGGFSGALALGLGGDSVTNSIGGKGGAGGNSGVVTVTSSGHLETKADNTVALTAQSIGGGGGSGGFSLGLSIASSNDAKSLTQGVGGKGGVAGDAANVTVTNTAAGKIETFGALSIGILAQSVGGGGGNGGFAVGGSLSLDSDAKSSVGGGAGGAAGNAGEKVLVSNFGQVTTHGAQSVGILAQSVGGGGGSGGFAGGLSVASGGATNSAIGGNGGGGGIGQQVEVYNAGLVHTTQANSIGILAQSIGGGGGSGGFSLSGAASFSGGKGVSNSIGGEGAGGGKGGDVKVTNDVGGQIITEGAMSTGILAQSIGGGGGSGGFTIAGTLTSGSDGATSSVGGKAAAGGDGGKVTVDNKSTITLNGANSVGIMAQSVGGGGGSGGFAGSLNLSGGSLGNTVGGQGGAGGNGGDVIVTSTGNINTNGANSIAVLAQSVGGGGGYGGFALGAATGNGGDLKLGAANTGVAGHNGTVTVTINGGSLTTKGALASGALIQGIGGGGGYAGIVVDGSTSIGGDGLNLELGSHGSLVAAGTKVTASNSSSITTDGIGALGYVAQSIGGGGGVGGFSAAQGASIAGGLSAALGTFGGSGGGDGEVTDVKSLAGTIATKQAGSVGLLAQSIGGGGGVTILSGVPASGTIKLGASSGAKGDGKAVTVENLSAITTTGTHAHGLVAQSIGGGGGLVFANNTNGDAVALSVVGGAGGLGGSGGPVNVTNKAMILTSGVGAHGIVAQSVGGGGGIVGGGNFATTLGTGSFAGSVGGAGTAGTVTVKNQAIIFSSGLDANAVFGQSVKADGFGANIDITLEKTALGRIDVRGGGGTGAGVMFSGGANNTLTNSSIISAVSFLAVRGTVGNDAIVNINSTLAPTGHSVNDVATIFGNINMGDGTNSLLNENVNGLAKVKSFDPTTNSFIILGNGNQYENRGIQSVQDIGAIGTTALTGKYLQTATGQYITDVDLNSQTVDRLNLTTAGAGINTANFGGTGPLNFLSIDKLFDRYILSQAPDGMTNNGFEPTFRPTVGFDFEATVENGTNLVLFANKPTFLSLIQNPASGTTDSNVLAMAGYFDQIEGCCGVDNPMARLINMLRFLPDHATLGTVLNRLTPHYAAHTVDITNRATESLTDLHRSCERNPSAVYNDRDCLWFTASPVLKYEKDGGLTATSRDDRLITVSLGLQKSIDQNWTLGASIGMADTKSKISTAFERLSDQFGSFYNANLFAKYDDGPWFADLLVGGGVGTFRGSRDTRVPRVESIPCDGCAPILLPGIGERVDYKQQMTAFGGSSRLGYTVDYAPFYAQPQVQLNAWWYRMDGYSESGSLAAMTFPSATNFNFSVVPALEIGANAMLGYGYKLKSYVRGGIEFSTKDAWEVAAHFSALPAETGMLTLRDKVDSPRWLVDTGLTYITPTGSGLTIGYRGAFADKSEQHQVFGKAEIRF